MSYQYSIFLEKWIEPSRSIWNLKFQINNEIGHPTGSPQFPQFSSVEHEIFVIDQGREPPFMATTTVVCGDVEGCDGEISLDLLPAALLETIMTKLDVASLCSLASTCKTLKSCVTRVLTFTPNFHIFVSLHISIDLIAFFRFT